MLSAGGQGVAHRRHRVWFKSVSGLTRRVTVEEANLSIEVLAERWLTAERTAAQHGNLAGTEDDARIASAAYERAIASASREDLLLAWHAARRTQSAAEMGSTAWAHARAVSELIRLEYLSSE